MPSEVTSHLLLGEIAGQPHSWRVSITASGGRGSGVQIRISSPFAAKMEFPPGVKVADRTSKYHFSVRFMKSKTWIRDSTPAAATSEPSGETARPRRFPPDTFGNGFP